MPRLVFADHFLIEALPFVAPAFLIVAFLLVMVARDRLGQGERRSASADSPSSTRSSPNA